MHWPASDSPTLTEAFRAGPIEAIDSTAPTSTAQDLKLELAHCPRLAPPLNRSERRSGHVMFHSNRPRTAAQKAKDAYLGDRLAALCGYPARFCTVW